MKLRAKIVLALTALGSLALVAPAQAGQVCYDVNLNVGGQTVSQADCVDTP
jgi:hypothetical protein